MQMVIKTLYFIEAATILGMYSSEQDKYKISTYNWEAHLLTDEIKNMDKHCYWLGSKLIC